MLYSSRLPVNVLTDHVATCSIVEQTRLDISSTNRANRRLITTSIYLSKYELKVYYLLGRLNYVPDVLNCLRALTDLEPNNRANGDVVLDDAIFAFAEVCIE